MTNGWTPGTRAYNVVEHMRALLSRRGLAAGAFALYALVVAVLVPLHEALEASGSRPAPVAGPVADADCRDRDCHESSHRHGSRVHDSATCASCAQARAASSPAPAVAVAGAVLDRIGGAESPPSAVLPAAGRSRRGARAPPVLS